MLKVFLLMAVFSAAAHAQPIPNGTIDVYFQQLSRNGVPDGCSLVFTAVASDTAYRNGAQVTMNGSIAVRDVDGKRLMFTGKLGTRTFEESGSQWSAPHYFYFTTKTGTTAGKSKVIAAETAGYKLLIVDATEPPITRLIVEIAKTGSFTVGFNRRENGQDVYSRVDLSKSLKSLPNGSAEITTNTNTQKEFDACFVALVDDMMAKPSAPPGK